MEIRQAILKAADWIEGHPGEFKFSETDIPHGCGTPGCALGWIGYFAGCKRGVHIDTGQSPVKRLDLESQIMFYERLDAFFGGGKYCNPQSIWRYDPSQCAEVLRLYADKYHPIKLPDWNALASEPLPASECVVRV